MTGSHDGPPATALPASAGEPGAPEPCLPEPCLPDYGGACLDALVPALLARSSGHTPPWLPVEAAGAPQVVLLVLDGLGWHQLRSRPALAPALTAMTGGPITSVAPTTTAAALTSISTGAPPALHGVVGYKVHVGQGEVLNVLRWKTASGDARATVDPAGFQRRPAFGGIAPPVVSRAEFQGTGFTLAHMSGTRPHGWLVPSSLVLEVRRLVAAGEPFVYAYYDGIDKVAHATGLGPHYDAELAFVDRLVADLLDALPPSAVLVVTADHGQVDVGEAMVSLDPAVAEVVAFVSGEGRFRWLHARPGLAGVLAERAAAAHGQQAWVTTRDEAVSAGWFGGVPEPVVLARYGDVALVAHEPIAFLDPADPGEARLRSRHGSLTEDEVLVPLVAAGGVRQG